MRFFVIIIVLISLTGCLDDDISYNYGLPTALFHESQTLCTAANSSLDRIYVSAISTQYVTISAEDAELVEREYQVWYHSTIRCTNGASFLNIVKTKSADSDRIGSVVKSANDVDGY